MASTKREALKEALIDAAEARIAVHGLAGLRARDVTKDAGCALGSLYNVFEDMDFLVLAVNSRTLARLDQSLSEAAAGCDEPEAQLQAMAAVYMAFAGQNPTLWAALFDHQMPTGVPVPDWHIAEHATLIGHIATPLAVRHPDWSEAQVALRARSIFSAVHGVVRLSLEDRFVALPQDTLASELSDIVARVI